MALINNPQAAAAGQAMGQTVYPTWAQGQPLAPLSVNIQLERIDNGWLVTLPSGKKVFADVAPAVCGVISEWVLEACEKYERI